MAMQNIWNEYPPARAYMLYPEPAGIVQTSIAKVSVSALIHYAARLTHNLSKLRSKKIPAAHITTTKHLKDEESFFIFWLYIYILFMRWVHA